MSDERIYDDVSPLAKRARAVFVAVAAIFLFLVFSYWKIQILDHAKFWAMSEANRTRETVIPAPRAALTDRTGQIILVNNVASFKASIIRENTRDLDASCVRIGELIGLDPGVVRERVEKYKAEPPFKPIVVKDNLTFDEVARIEARKLDLPELVIETEPKRSYPFGTLGAHVLGYMQELTTDELRGEFKDRRLGDRIGRTGVESAYERRIAGVDGRLVEIVDSLGRKRDELERVDPRQPPKVVLDPRLTTSRRRRRSSWPGSRARRRPRSEDGRDPRPGQLPDIRSEQVRQPLHDRGVDGARQQSGQPDAQPGDPGPLFAGLDVQARHGRRGPRHRDDRSADDGLLLGIDR